VIAGIAAAAVLLVGLILLMLPDDEKDGVGGEAIETGSRVTIDEDRSTSTTEARTTTTREATTTTRRPTTTDAPATTEAPATVAPPPPTNAPTTPPAPEPARLTVTYPRDSEGRMLLTEGGVGAVIMNNVGGQPGGYAVSTTGEVSVLGRGNGTIEPGAVVQVEVKAAEEASDDIPQGTITVSGNDGVIVTIPVVIT